ncbi:MAG TPA: DUF309 domain-containing protein [Methylomirabilota bacterium]|nr:DUF309 domain-containing protein [Methylomirabilota bacterium]
MARDPRAWLDPDAAPWASIVGERARRASAALAGAPLTPPADVPAALAAAARLFDAGLFFEVHELLEPHWRRAHDAATRESLQGLIQIAVAWQHLANGNVAGARSLLGEGGARLHGRELDGIALDAFARAALETVHALPRATPPAFPRRPR